ncbi:hypothetical protein GGR50DRAFT_535541 [Xylaria sp. CBS 124048]|nr:hypothetical protein GGR50DRAFT_535541 [Xylaria sp. CBS 124048]
MKLRCHFRPEKKEMEAKKDTKKKQSKTYNTRDSLVVTDPTTDLALTGLSMGERTGSRVFHQVVRTDTGCSVHLVSIPSTDSLQIKLRWKEPSKRVGNSELRQFQLTGLYRSPHSQRQESPRTEEMKPLFPSFV